MKRRDLLKTSAIAAGGLSVIPSVIPSFASVLNDEMDIRVASPMDITFRVKFINDGIVHEGAWEGSCRFGDLNNLTYEVELNRINSNMKRLKETLARSAMFYLTVTSMMEKHQCNAFTIECFELCSSLNPWKRRFTPCLTHALLKDAGIPAACEGDINALLAMMVQKYLSRKAIYMGNPDLDIENNILKLHHSVASLKMFGIDEKPSPYNIHNFMVAGYGATLRHDFSQHIGEKVTVARFDPTASRMLVSGGEVVNGSGMEGCGCALNVEVTIPNGRRFWKKSQDYGHHLAFVYGDYIHQIEDFAELMNFKIENIDV